MKSLIYILTFCITSLICFKARSQHDKLNGLINSVLKKTDFKSQQALFLKISDSIWKKSDLKTHFKFLNEVGTQAAQNKNFELEAQTFISTGNLYNDIGRYSSAVVFYEKAKKHFEKENDNSGLSTVYLNMGNSYYYLEQKEEALSHYKMALTKLKTMKVGNESTETKLSNIYNNLGTMYCIKGDFKIGRMYFEKSFLISQKLKDSLSIAYSYNNLSKVLMQLGKSDSALMYVKKAVEIKERFGDNLDKSDAHRNLSSFYINKKNYTMALQEAKKALNYCDTAIFTEELAESYNSIQFICHLQKDFKNELKYYKLYEVACDSLDTQQQLADLRKKEMIFDFDKIHLTDSVKSAHELQQRDFELVQKKKESYFLFFALAFAALGIGFIYNRFKITKKQKVLIEQQKVLVDIKNKEIIESINYAKRLQDGILPSQKEISENFTESFVFYKPKDIIAGDFYWVETIGTDNQIILIAAADCTGHGVPGAMMSVACNNALHRAVSEFNITEPGKVLDKTRQLIIENFSKSESTIQDGMDISLLCVNHKTKIIEWSGANNRLLYIFNDELVEIKPDKQHIGISDKTEPFTTYQIAYQPGTVFYLFTDGLQDQFGGDKGKKYGISNFKQLISVNKEKSLDDQLQIIDSAFLEWKKGAEQVDDITILGLKI